jgi:hypothetical protein
VSDCELTDTYSPAAIDIAPEAGHARNQNIALLSSCRRDANDEARRRNDTVVRFEHCCSQPSDTVYQMALGVRVKPAHGDLI